MIIHMTYSGNNSINDEKDKLNNFDDIKGRNMKFKINSEKRCDK